MGKLAIIGILVVLSFFINLLYYVTWIMMDHWLVAEEKPGSKPEGLMSKILG